MDFLKSNPTWIRKPANFKIENDRVEITTEPGTDLWSKTYYGFQTDTAPVLQVTTENLFFSFVVKTKFDSSNRFDQCGLAMYLDKNNWIKASIEYEDRNIQRLGSVVTNNGFSDWATTDISSEIDTMWYRLSRRESDFRIEHSEDGINWKQMRIFHMWNASRKVSFGIYAGSPTDGSYKALFTNMSILECQWENDNEWKS